MPETKNILMWSGPRNISTAMMRSWENRPDTHVHDEPFYAFYLHNTDYEHPGAEEVIAAYPTDWRDVVQQVTAAPPAGTTIYYQKHMTHHMLPQVDLRWILPLTNAFLIREPRLMLISLLKKLPDPQIDQTGLPEQIRIFRYLREETGQIPPVLDSKDVLLNPRAALTKLCTALEVPFDEAMLSWPAGKRDTDGVWAKYWYASVEASTGFMPYEDRGEAVPEDFAGLLRECNELYDEMRRVGNLL
ncbi:MAG: HAD family hydrolase [Anaerolineae bacterium]|nr:HAD family hydrolase [Anaerolineae bacterium]